MEIAHHGVTSMFIMLGIVCMNISINCILCEHIINAEMNNQIR